MIVRKYLFILLLLQKCIIIIVVVVVVVVVVNDHNDDDNNNNNNIAICYPGSLSTSRRHSQIRKVYDGHSVEVGQGRIPSAARSSNGKVCEVINYV